MGNDRIKPADVSERSVTEFLGNDWDQRIFNPLSDSDAHDRLLSLRRSWNESESGWPCTVVMTSGAFDLMHLDHAGYIVHTKAVAAQHHFDTHYSGSTGQEWQGLSEEDKILWWQEFIANGELRLIVSIDGNESISKRKGFNPDKGNVTRPIYDWMTRARMVGSLCIPNVHQGGYVPVADAVTSHDPISLAGTPHENLYDLASSLSPDTWTIYAESDDIIDYLPTDARLDDIVVACIADSDNYFDDLLLGGKFSTTKIVNRIKSE